MPHPGNASGEFSYSAATSGLTPTSSATDIIAIGGKAGRKTYVKHLELVGLTTGTGPVVDVLLFKRSVANTTGHEIDAPFTPHDSDFPAATATVTVYSTNPTVGAAVGIVGATRVVLSTTATFQDSRAVFDWTGDVAPITLNTSEEQLCVNLNGATLLGPSMRFFVQITQRTT